MADCKSGEGWDTAAGKIRKSEKSITRIGRVYTKITSKPVPIEQGNDEKKAHNRQKAIQMDCR